jgi:hypothetical protein
MRRGLLAVHFAALTSLGLASAAPTLAGSPHDKIDDPTIIFDDSPSGKHSTTKYSTSKYNTTATPYASGPATSATHDSNVIIQDGTDNKAHVHRHGGASHESTIEQNGTSNSTHINHWGTSQKADVHQTGNDLSVQVHQLGDDRAIGINQFGQGHGGTVTVMQY